MLKRYVSIPDHTFCVLVDLIGVMASYIPDVPPFIRDSMDNCLRDILKEVDYEWKEQRDDKAFNP